MQYLRKESMMPNPILRFFPVVLLVLGCATGTPVMKTPVTRVQQTIPMERVTAYLQDAAALVEAYGAGYADQLTGVQRADLVARFRNSTTALRARYPNIDTRLADAVKDPACAAARRRLGAAIDACLTKYADRSGFWTVLARLTGPVGQGDGAPVNMDAVRSMAIHGLKKIDAESPLLSLPDFRTSGTIVVPVYANIAPHPVNGMMYRPGRYYFLAPAGTRGVAVKELCNGFEGLRNAIALQFADGRKGWIDWRHAWEPAHITVDRPAYDNPRLAGTSVGTARVGDIVATIPQLSFGFRGVDAGDVVPLRYPDGRHWYVQVGPEGNRGDLPYMALKTAWRIVYPEETFSQKNNR